VGRRGDTVIAVICSMRDCTWGHAAGSEGFRVKPLHPRRLDPRPSRTRASQMKAASSPSSVCRNSGVSSGG
jgi:hypothetical protein